MSAVFKHRAAKGLLVVLVVLFFVLCGVHLAGAHHDGDLHGVALAVYSSMLVLILLGALVLFGVFGRYPMGSGHPLACPRQYRRTTTLFAAQSQPLRC